MSITWRATAAGLEAVTALCAALNLAYFVGRMTSSRPLTFSRRLAAFVLALISAGTLAESIFVLLSLWASGDDSLFASPGWAAVRIIASIATAGVSTLVLKAIGNNR